MHVFRAAKLLVAAATIFPLAMAKADFTTYHPDPLEFPDSSTFLDFPDALPLIKTIVEILNRNDFIIYKIDYPNGFIQSKRLMDANNQEIILFRLIRDVTGGTNIQLEWLYGQYVIGMGSPEPRRVVVKQGSKAVDQVINEVQIAVLNR